ncbi:hypothetical protein [Chryseobacterium luquanense]|uniref:Lipoprotein n=1 Tax=Chryseobacterium luquanense TaxID=2983766 RepID=A0ABT3Y1P7_9FLAO|nr:hypothetical protein [Chryseobacterium luquanense]MCX8532072.1 hypothetical protein [Chryseobacterium luquanense]
MNKLRTPFFLLLFFLTISCKSQNYKETKNIIINSVESYIKYKNENATIDNKKNIIIIGANSANDKDKNISVSFYFINPNLLVNFNYSKVYSMNKYKIAIDKSLNKSDILEYAFKDFEIPYENFNLAKLPYSYNHDYWNLIIDSNSEIIEILPEEKSKEIKNILEKKGVKISKNYIE